MFQPTSPPNTVFPARKRRQIVLLSRRTACMAAWPSELQVHRIAFPLRVFAFTLGFPTIFPTNTLNPRKVPRYVIKRTKTRRTSNPLQHKGLEVLSRHEWVRRKSSHGFLVRMRSAVRIRPAAPRYKETPPCRVVFLFSLKRMLCRSRASSQAVEKAAGFFDSLRNTTLTGGVPLLWSGGSFVPPTHGNLSFIPQPASGRPAWRAGSGRAEAPRLRPRRY